MSVSEAKAMIDENLIGILTVNDKHMLVNMGNLFVFITTDMETILVNGEMPDLGDTPAIIFCSPTLDNVNFQSLANYQPFVDLINDLIAKGREHQSEINQT